VNSTNRTEQYRRVPTVPYHEEYRPPPIGAGTRYRSRYPGATSQLWPGTLRGDPFLFRHHPNFQSLVECFRDAL